MFTIQSRHFGAFPTVVVGNDRTEAVFALRGGTLLAWRVAGADLVDGYATPDELAEQASVRSGLLAPFSNRIALGRYVFDGRSVDFHEAGSPQAGQAVYHGLIRQSDMVLTHTEATDTAALLTLRSDALASGDLSGYPYRIDVAVRIVVTETTLDLTITGTNIGAEDAPYAAGWHPYFTIGEAPIAELALTVSARTQIRRHDDLIPLDGHEAYGQVAADSDFSGGRLIGGQAVDVAYFDLERAADGLVHTRLTDGRTSLDVWQERGGVHVFTAETAERARRSVSIEPIEVMTNAFNRADQTEAVRLAPGGTRSFRFGVTVTTALEQDDA